MRWTTEPDANRIGLRDNGFLTGGAFLQEVVWDGTEYIGVFREADASRAWRLLSMRSSDGLDLGDSVAVASADPGNNWLTENATIVAAPVASDETIAAVVCDHTEPTFALQFFHDGCDFAFAVDFDLPSEFSPQDIYFERNGEGRFGSLRMKIWAM